MRAGCSDVTVIDAMRGVAVTIAAMSVLAACGATEGPLLRLARDADAGAAQDGSAGAGGGAGAAGGLGTGMAGGTAGGGAAGEAASRGTGATETPVAVGMTFQYQLQGTIDTDVDAELFVVDLFNADRDVIEELHAQGRVVAAYVSAGTLEPGRPDTDEFPDSAVGEPLANYPSESWLDVRDPTVRRLMAERLSLARDKGFDGIVGTSMAAYATDSGFPLTAADQLDYARWLAAEVRMLGMAPAMTGDYAQVDALVDSFDWAVTSRCIARGTCAQVAPFAAAGKPRFDLEYEGELDTICPAAEAQQIVAIRKEPDLDAWREACP
jgi:hypothetical protein